MHNWIEGVLQHHARHKWGLGGESQGGETVVNPGSDSPSSPLEDVMDIDVDLLAEELALLHEESQQFTDMPSQLKRAHTESTILGSLSSNSIFEHDENLDDDEDFEPDEESEDETTEGDEIQPTCVFNEESLSKIRDCLFNAAIPTWLARPPTNLGEKSHGKLKADQWLVLFSVFLPLVLPEIWSATGDKYQQSLLSNFADLVTCTNIVCAYSTSNTAADAYMEHYVRYRQSSTKLFPNVGSRPNHHYAMHNGDLLRYWGPLIRLSEFAYERHNGSLQKIKTNQHICKPLIVDFVVHILGD